MNVSEPVLVKKPVFILTIKSIKNKGGGVLFGDRSVEERAEPKDHRYKRPKSVYSEGRLDCPLEPEVWALPA